MTENELMEEAESITNLLKGRVVKSCVRHASGEILIMFEDGTRLFVNANDDLEFSITGC
ncbi:hypothetical protein ACTXGQ_18865 [Marinobacter sp. 1Y8]